MLRATTAEELVDMLSEDDDLRGDVLYRLELREHEEGGE